jgi:hypothetical protein
MGYDIRITRGSENPITLDEWIIYLKDDAEMRLDGFAEARAGADGQLIRLERPGLAAWTGHPGGGNVWFMHSPRRGIVVKNPDDEIIAKMLEIAAALRGRVIGDEGEEYT